jgi:hypothetical protein
MSAADEDHATFHLYQNADAGHRVLVQYEATFRADQAGAATDPGFA